MVSTLLLLTALTAQPVNPPPADVAAEVRMLLLDLDAPQKNTRDAAEKRLIELGPRILPLLPQRDAIAAAETAVRVARIRTALYQAQVAAGLQASYVSLDLRDAPLKDVLSEIERRTGNPLIDHRRAFGQRIDDIRVSLKADKLPFWRTIDDLCARSGLGVYHFAGIDGLALIAAPPNVAPVCYAGAFRFTIERITAARRPADSVGDLQIELSAAWEPRLKPLFLTAASADVEALDENRRPLEPRNRDAVQEISPQGKACRIELRSSFTAPPRSVARIARLHGIVKVMVPAELHEFRFSRLDSTKRQTQEAAAARVTVDPPRVNGDALEIPLRLSYDGAGAAFESHRGWFYKNPAYLESTDGATSAPASVELTGQAGEELTLTVSFSSVGDWRSQTFVYRTPADIVALPVEYEFHDLPLP